MFAGAFGAIVALIVSGIVLVYELFGRIEVPGYTALALLILFFDTRNSFGLEGMTIFHG